METLLAILLVCIAIRISSYRSGHIYKGTNPTPKYKKPPHPATINKTRKRTVPKPPGTKGEWNMKGYEYVQLEYTYPVAKVFVTLFLIMMIVIN